MLLQIYTLMKVADFPVMLTRSHIDHSIIDFHIISCVFTYILRGKEFFRETQVLVISEAALSHYLCITFFCLFANSNILYSIKYIYRNSIKLKLSIKINFNFVMKFAHV